jgi:dienelactone hydrolase
MPAPRGRRAEAGSHRLTGAVDKAVRGGYVRDSAMNEQRSLTISRAIMLLAGAALVAASWWFALEPTRELAVRHGAAGPRGELPVTLVLPGDASGTDRPATLPGVLVAHGFGSSRQIMLGYAYELAYAGYGVLLWDFGGHGANPAPLDRGDGSLQRDIDLALEYLIGIPAIDRDRLAIVGHSMGSGAAMRAAIRMPDTFDAVVAVSPTDAPVTEALPPNLLLQAGSWEQRFVENARRLLSEAGGEAPSPDAMGEGVARDLTVIPNVEHIGILFSNRAQDAARVWLDSALAPAARGAGADAAPATEDDAASRGRAGGLAASASYADRRVALYAVQFAGWMLLAFGVGRLVRRLVPADAGRGRGGLPAMRGRWWWIGMVGAPFVATGLIAVVDQLLPDAVDALVGLGGMLVVGVLAVWFALYGALWLAVGFRPSRPRGVSLGVGVLLFAFLWIAVGLMGEYVALRWILIPFRLLRWPAVAALVLPWLLAAGYAQHRSPLRVRIGVYLGQTIGVVGALAIAGLAIEGLYVIVLLLPALPLALGAMAVAGGVTDDPWTYAVGNALFFGWLLAALLPLAG